MYQEIPPSIRRSKRHPKQLAVEIYRPVEDPEIPDLIETRVIFTEVVIPSGWEIKRVWKPEEEGEFWNRIQELRQTVC